MNTFIRIVEIYKCVILTVIAAAMIVILMRTPVPYTIQNVREGVVKDDEAPVVWVRNN